MDGAGLRLNLPSSEAHLWCFSTRSLDADQLLRARGLLVEDELDANARILDSRAKTLDLLARAGVRAVLSKYDGRPTSAWRFVRDAHGRPRAEGSDLFFSLSHCDGLVVLLVSRESAIGVDVEFVQRSFDLQTLCGAACDAAELKRIETASASERRRVFLEHWTLKEAYAKARGLGLALPFQHIGFTIEDQGIRLRLHPCVEDTPQNWQLARLSLGPDHVGAVALRKTGGHAPHVSSRWAAIFDDEGVALRSGIQ